MAWNRANVSVGSGDQFRADGTVEYVADRFGEYLGGKGCEMITADGNAHTPATGQAFIALHFVADTVIADYDVDATAPITGTITGVTWDKGTVIYGRFTSIELTSGSVVAYNGIL